MQTVELRPRQLEELADQLDFEFKRFHTQGVHIRREADAVRVQGRVQTGWSVEWKDPVWTLRLHDSVIRCLLGLFESSLQWQQNSFTLLIKEKKPSADLRAEFGGSWTEGRSPVQEVFLRRAFNAVAHLGELSDPVLQGAIAAPSDQGVVVRALQSPEALAGVQSEDPLFNARLRGIAAKQRLLESHGGSISVEEAARLLRITRQAVDKRRRNGQLLAVAFGRRGYHYPVWQFADSGTLPGLESILRALKDHDPWMQVAFFVSPNPRLEGKSPASALSENRVDEVLIAAQAYGEQGAA